MDHRNAGAAIFPDYYRLFQWYAKKLVGAEDFEDVAHDGISFFLCRYEPGRCVGPSGFIRKCVMSAADRLRKKKRKYRDHVRDATESLLSPEPEPFPTDDEVSAVHAALAAMRERWRIILILRYGLHDVEPLTLECIGKSLSLSKVRVRQIETQALDALRRALASRKEFVENVS